MDKSTVLEPLLTPTQLSGLVGIPVETIYQWRSRGGGPRGIRVGRHLRFRQSDVARWLEDHAEPEQTP